MPLQPKTGYTFEDYLAAERAELHIRHEYVAGEVFAMVGATATHNIIVANLIGGLWTQMKGSPCFVYSNDMRVRIESADASLYPDVLAHCGDPQFHDDRQDVLLNPALVVEVLSPSTEAYDRGDKFAIYRRLPSLQEYLLVSQERMRAELFLRGPDGRWLLGEYSGPEESVPLESVGCALPLSEIYDKVGLSEAR
jgi:Uma2 family endonuclease